MVFRIFSCSSGVRITGLVASVPLVIRYWLIVMWACSAFFSISFHSSSVQRKLRLLFSWSVICASLPYPLGSVSGIGVSPRSSEMSGVIAGAGAGAGAGGGASRTSMWKYHVVEVLPSGSATFTEKLILLFPESSAAGRVGVFIV